MLVHECNLAIIGPRTVAFAQTVTDCYIVCSYSDQRYSNALNMYLGNRFLKLWLHLLL